MIEEFLICLGVFWALYLYLTSTFHYWRSRGVIHPKPTFFFGNIKEALTLKITPGECHQKIYNQYPDEPFVGIWQLHAPTLLVRDPELIKDIMVKSFQHFTDRGFNFNEKREPLTANLVSLAGEKWKNLRQKLTPTFSSSKLKSMTDLLQKCTSELMTHLSKSVSGKDVHECEMRELMAKYTTDVIGSVAFGLEFESFATESSQFRIVGRQIFKPSVSNSIARMARQFFPSMYNCLRLRTFPRHINDFFQNLVSDTIRLRKANNIQRNDFMQLLIQLKDDEKDSFAHEKNQIAFNDSTITAQAFIFFTAGFETTSTTLSFALYELAMNSNIQEKALQELQEVWEKHGEFNYESAREMVYIENILQETMRKYPPVMTLSRICTEPTTIPGTKIEIAKHTKVLIPVYAIHNDPQYYPEPEVFDPDRFTPEKVKTRPNFTFLPFGEGPRICIGMRFAYLEMKLCLAKFLRKFQVRLNPKTSVPLEFDPTVFIMTPKSGIWLDLFLRDN